MRQQQLETKLELHTSLHEKLALTLAKVSYKMDFLIIAIESKREGGNFLEYTYVAWNEKDGDTTLIVTVVKQDGFDIYADIEYMTSHHEWKPLHI